MERFFIFIVVSAVLLLLLPYFGVSYDRFTANEQESVLPYASKARIGADIPASSSNSRSFELDRLLNSVKGQ